MSDILVTRPWDRLALVTINRPKRRNALDGEAWRDLGGSFAALDKDNTTRGVILTGAGGAFCAGDDIFAAAQLRGRDDARKEYMDHIWACYAAVSNIRVPVVAAVSGPCFGGGCTLALRADFRVADRTARFGIPPAKLGIVYPPDSTALLVATVGGVKAKQLLYSGNSLDAANAAEWGLVDEVTNGDVVQRARDMLADMLDNAPISIAASKLACNAAMTGRISDDAAQVWALSDLADKSLDSIEGSRAFAEKRKPKFIGR